MGLIDSLISEKTLYVKIRRDTFIIKDLQSKRIIERKAHEPFSSLRLLIGDYLVAESLLRDCFRELLKGIQIVKPVVLIHPLDMVDEGLAPVEERILHELAAGAGARRAVIWTGPELTDDQVLQKIKQQ